MSDEMITPIQIHDLVHAAEYIEESIPLGEEQTVTIALNGREMLMLSLGAATAAGVFPCLSDAYGDLIHRLAELADFQVFGEHDGHTEV